MVFGLYYALFLIISLVDYNIIFTFNHWCFIRPTTKLKKQFPVMVFFHTFAG